MGHDFGDTFAANQSNLAVTWKVQPKLLHLVRDLADCVETDQTIAGRAYRPLPPANLRVFGDGVNPVYTSGQDIAVAWDLTSPARCVTPPEQDLADEWSDATLLQVLDVATETVKGEWTVAPDGLATITNAALFAALGSEADFILRAYNQRAGLNSLAFDTITVTRI